MLWALALMLRLLLKPIISMVSMLVRCKLCCLVSLRFGFVLETSVATQLILIYGDERAKISGAVEELAQGTLRPNISARGPKAPRAC